MQDQEPVVPGEFRCPQCGFVLTQSILYAANGAVARDTADRLEPCPNDGTILRPVLYADALAEARGQACKLAVEVRTAEHRVAELKGGLADRVDRHDRDGKALIRAIDARDAMRSALLGILRWIFPDGGIGDPVKAAEAAEAVVREWREELDRLRQTASEQATKVRDADRLADAVAGMVTSGRLSSRSVAADALLDYRNPPRTEQSDLIGKLEAELEQLRAAARTPADPAPEHVCGQMWFGRDPTDVCPACEARRDDPPPAAGKEKRA
jgi:rubrerythrin